MKVLKEGKWNIPWTAEVSCSTCEAKLLTEEVDVKPVMYSNSGYCCSCPVCSKSISLEGKLIAQRVREVVDAKRPYYSPGSPWD